MKALDKLCSVIDWIIAIVTAAIVIFLTVLIGWNVISRYVLGNPIAWQYEATLLCMPWIVFLGMVITFRQDEHMRLTFVSNAMPEKVRNIFIVVLDILVLVFFAYGGYVSISVVQNAWPTIYQTIPVSKGLFYLPFPIGAFCSVVMIFVNCYKRMKGIPMNQPIE